MLSSFIHETVKSIPVLSPQDVENLKTIIDMTYQKMINKEFEKDRKSSPGLTNMVIATLLHPGAP